MEKLVVIFFITISVVASGNNIFAGTKNCADQKLRQQHHRYESRLLHLWKNGKKFDSREFTLGLFDLTSTEAEILGYCFRDYQTVEEILVLRQRGNDPLDRRTIPARILSKYLGADILSLPDLESITLTFKEEE